MIAAEGEEVAAECVERFGVPPERVAVVPNGRDPDEFRPGPAHDPPVLSFVGALTPGKRPDRFVEVAQALRDRGETFRAILTGGGELASPLVGPAAGAGVELAGPSDAVADRMRDADIFVFPSRPAGEGMPGVLIEAGLSGLPVVATAVPGVASIVRHGETGLVVPVDDLPAMVDAVGRLVADREGRAAMGLAARRHCVGSFSLEAVGARWLALLEPLLAAARSGRS